MRQYRRFTEEHRIEIYAMKQAGCNQTQMAQHLGVHRSTISRELARNTGGRGYRPKQAHRLAVERRGSAGKARKMTQTTIAYIEALIRKQHAPQQIAGRMKVDPEYRGPTVSHERIYQHIWQDKAIDTAFIPAPPTTAGNSPNIKPWHASSKRKSISPILTKLGNAVSTNRSTA